MRCVPFQTLAAKVLALLVALILLGEILASKVTLADVM
jgi:hypothetical protein